MDAIVVGTTLHGGTAPYCTSKPYNILIKADNEHAAMIESARRMREEEKWGRSALLGTPN